MLYKRHEPFRFVFEPPLDMTFHIQRTDAQLFNLHGEMAGKIIDLSPHGMKMFCDFKLQNDLPTSTKMKIRFVIDTRTIEAQGEVKWNRVLGNLCELGILFKDGQALEEMIISELKLRRRKEVLGDGEESIRSKGKEKRAFRNKTE